MCCGQTLESSPDNITCLKSGKDAEEAKKEVEKLWELDPKALTLHLINVETL